jgi:hypothetical protein
MLGADLTKEYAPAILMIYSLLGAAIFYCYNSSIHFVSPNALVFFYCSISLALGSLGMRDGLSLVPRTVLEYERHAYTHVALSFVMLGLTFLPLIQMLFGRREAPSEFSCQIKFGNLIPIFLVILPVAFFGLDLSVFGGSGNLGVYAQSFISVYLIVFLSRYPIALRYVGFIAILVLMVILHPHDKRIAIFLILPFIFLEFRIGALRLSLSSIIVVFTIVCILIFLVLIMSIARGYGDFDVDGSVLLAVRYVGEYVSSDTFVAAFFQNIEVTYFYFHYVNAIEFVASGLEAPRLGETLIKPLFLPIPRDVIGWKPESIIHIYTNAYDPVIRSIGGSWPPNFAADYFWNFHAFGILLFPVFAWCNVCIFNILTAYNADRRPGFFIFVLYVYMNILTYARGSGLDLFVFIIGVGGVFLVLSSFVHLVLVAASRR